MTVLIEIWCGGKEGPGTQGHHGKRGIGFTSKCWKRITKEHGNTAGLILAVLSRGSWFGDGAAHARTTFA